MPPLTLLGLLTVTAPTPALVEAAPSEAFCSGDYADDLSALSPHVRELDRAPNAAFSYCVRNVAVYECLSYGADGNIRRVRRRAVLHGTAFAYRQQAGDTLLLTNDHVAAWPAVTDDDHAVEGIPAGCKKVSEALRIVDNDDDAYDRDDIPLTRVATDPALDAAILKAHASLQILPWKIGSSAALRERNAVEVRGFPLGAFRATNVGKVVSTYDHDSYRDWEHDDFVIDALLSSGNSGSPVLAVSCRTGEYELVGVFHAAYARGSALNVVVGIDQLRDLMTTLARAPHPAAQDTPAADAARRPMLLEAVAAGQGQYWPFGGLVAAAFGRSDGSLAFVLYPRDFPVKSFPILVLEDLPPRSLGDFGEPGRVWFGGCEGLRSYARSDLDADAQAQVARLLELMRQDATLAAGYGAAAREAPRSRERFEQSARLEASLRKIAASRRDLAQAAAELADRLASRDPATGESLAHVLASPPPRPAEAQAAAKLGGG
jgi:serine protease Do